eukprot:6197999-Pleurochrysis_carterae.AAC.1
MSIRVAAGPAAEMGPPDPRIDHMRAEADAPAIMGHVAPETKHVSGLGPTVYMSIALLVLGVLLYLLRRYRPTTFLWLYSRVHLLAAASECTAQSA